MNRFYPRSYELDKPVRAGKNLLMVFLLGGSSKSGAPSGGAGGTARANLVFDVSTPQFEAEVIARSAKTPVLLDLWAPWCEPCKTLGPALEKLTREANGAFLLARLDVEANPEVAGLLGVQSVPTVVLFLKGRPVDAFVGALPEAQIRAFLSRHIRLAAAPLKEEEEEAGAESPESLLGEGRAREALARIRAKSDPLLEIRAAVLAGETKRAERVLAAVPKEKEADDIVLAAQRLLELLSSGENEIGKLMAPLTRGEVGPALDALLASGNEEARRPLLDILLLLGRGPYPDAYRTRLSRLLFR